MLSLTEKSVLKVVLQMCGERNACLASSADILCRLHGRIEVSEERLSDVLKCLEFDGYIDVVLSDRRGEMIYCITLKERGKGYKRERVQSKRYMIYRIVFAVASAVITFFIGRLLFAIID